MRIILLFSAVALTPSLALAAPNCAVAPSGSVQAPPAVPVHAADPAAGKAVPVNAGPPGALPSPAALSGEQIAASPVLARIASHGASLSELGAAHGLRTVFARSGNAFQVFYLAPDGQAAIGGVMWDANGHDVTRDQVAPIPGTVPTVSIGDPGTMAQSAAASGEVPKISLLKVAEGTTYGTLGDPRAPRLWMFIDPMCAYSVRAMGALKPYVAAGKIQLAVIPLSELDYEDQGRSTPAAQIMVSKPGDQMVGAWTGQQLAGTPPQGAAALLAANMTAATAIQLRGTPTFLWHRADGSVGRADGIPDDFGAMIASVGH